MPDYSLSDIKAAVDGGGGRFLGLKPRRGLAYNPESPFQRIAREGFG